MAKQTDSHKPRTSSRGPSSGHDGPRELVIFMSAESAPLALPGGLEGLSTVIDSALLDVMAQEGVAIHPLFAPLSSADRSPSLDSEGASDAAPAAELQRFYYVEAPDDKLEGLAERLRNTPSVVAAFVKPPAEPAAVPRDLLNPMQPQVAAPPAQTPDFTPRQGYLDAAPDGIDARFAWTLPGGRGQGVNIIDCEWNWRTTHEDLKLNKGGVVVGVAGGDQNHGTAVLGEFGGDANGFGVTGICSDAHVRMASFASLPTARVIQQAADLLQPGDILLLEIHRAGPDANGSGQDGYIAVEWWPDDLAAIRYAVRRGVIVVEAGGNGARNLDAAIFNTPQAGFPPSWKNPFNPANPGSGAVVVGAGAPPLGTHGKDYGPGRSRLDFSNYGSRVDAQGWGREVTTTGYGDLQGGPDPDKWYTDQFSGTSSASPIVVGALGCAQGCLRAANLPLLTPETARRLLRETGSPQQDFPGQQGVPPRPRTQRIGNLPDLRAILTRLLNLPTSNPVPVDQLAAGGNPQVGNVVINIYGSSVTVNIKGN